MSIDIDLSHIDLNEVADWEIIPTAHEANDIIWTTVREAGQFSLYAVDGDGYSIWVHDFHSLDRAFDYLRDTHQVEEVFIRSNDVGREVSTREPVVLNALTRIGYTSIATKEEFDALPDGALLSDCDGLPIAKVDGLAHLFDQDARQWIPLDWHEVSNSGDGYSVFLPLGVRA